MAILKRRGYKGNPKLKRAGETTNFTEEQLAEYMRCVEDPIYFIRNYMKIIVVGKGVQPLDLYEWQEEACATVLGNRFSIAKVARQAGKTTFVVGLITWYVLFHEHFKVALLANKELQAKEILSRIKLAYENIPLWMQQGIKDWSKTTVSLENGSEILAAATSPTSVTGRSLDMVYIDEFAKINLNLQQEFWASAYPTISSSETTKLIITSTPHGLDMFHQLWMEAESGKNDFKTIDIAWDRNPGRGEEFKKKTIGAVGAHLWRREYECKFLGSNLTLIDGVYLEEMSKSSLEAEFSESEDKALRIYKRPDKFGRYVMTVDVARGVGGDHSAFTVFDCTNKEKAEIVATYYSNTIRPVMFPAVIYRVADEYNNAHVLVETNDLGEGVADDLWWDHEYENLLTVVPGKRGKMPTISPVGLSGRGSNFGLKMSAPVKKVGCSNLKTIVEKGNLAIPDHRAVMELSSFVETGASYAAEKGKHDDLAMTLVMFSWLTGQEMYNEICSGDFERTVRDQNADDIVKTMSNLIGVSNGIMLKNNFQDLPMSDEDAELEAAFLRIYGED